MSKLDKAKEYIGLLKVYMGIVTALIMADVSATVNLFNSDILDISFWLGVVSIIMLAIVFIKLVKHAHHKVDELEEL
jgi:hypothetical protein